MNRSPHSEPPSTHRASIAVVTLLAASLALSSCSRQDQPPAQAALSPPGTRLPAPGSSWRPSQPHASQLSTPGISHRSLKPAARPASPGEPDHRTLSSPVHLPQSEPTHDRWRYLDAAQRRAIDAPSDAQGWTLLHLVSSGHQQTSAADLEHYHRHIRRLPDGIAYHFVIENGSRGPDGSIAATSRWASQHHAPPFVAPAGAISVALVGDHSSHPITEAQFTALEELTRYLRARFGPLPVQVAASLPDPLTESTPIHTPGLPQEIGARLASQ